jgi:O-acetylserine/cysteine efflux transporter
MDRPESTLSPRALSIGVLSSAVVSGAHLGLILFVVVIWGFTFVATRVALDDFSPPQLTALRFLVAAVPALWLPRPPLSAGALVLVGTPLFTGQFLFQFFGIALGAPPGLAALVVQTQALFTILFAALALGERPTARQWAGTAIAFAGLALIATTFGGDLTLTGLGLTVLSAMSWGVGNVLVKRLPPVDTLALMVWLSLVPPLPALAVALLLDGPGALHPSVLAAASWLGLSATLYIGLVATVLGYTIWGRLLRRYPAATVTPFALLIPFVAAAGSALAFGERFGTLRLAGMALVLAGLAVIVARRA